MKREEGCYRQRLRQIRNTFEFPTSFTQSFLYPDNSIIPISSQTTQGTHLYWLQIFQPSTGIKRRFLDPLVWANIKILGKSPRGWVFFLPLISMIPPYSFLCGENTRTRTVWNWVFSSVPVTVSVPVLVQYFIRTNRKTNLNCPSKGSASYGSMSSSRR